MSNKRECAFNLIIRSFLLYITGVHLLFEILAFILTSCYRPGFNHMPILTIKIGEV
jgi:hypothetical protein